MGASSSGSTSDWARTSKSRNTSRRRPAGPRNLVRNMPGGTMRRACRIGADGGGRAVPTRASRSGNDEPARGRCPGLSEDGPVHSLPSHDQRKARTDHREVSRRPARKADAR
jgi:hypothetical protein